MAMLTKCVNCLYLTNATTNRMMFSEFKLPRFLNTRKSITMQRKRINAFETTDEGIVFLTEVNESQKKNLYFKFCMMVEQVKSSRSFIKRVKKESTHWILVFLVETVIMQILLGTPYALAADPVKTYACLLDGCKVELAKCMSDLSCATYIACVETCNNGPNETGCQMKCGDLFENKAAMSLNQCAISKKKCIAKKPDDGQFPKPNDCTLVKKFDVGEFSGRWYISSGLNPLFDTFDCQVHDFFPGPGKVTGNWTWRISTPDGGFLTRSTVETFLQDSSQPGILRYHEDGYLHNQDEWYIISSQIENKPDDYIFVYYRGNNDAWDGYGGAVVYTRSQELPSSIVAQLEKSATSVGLDFSRFQKTNNLCGPQPSLLLKLENKVKEGEKMVAKVITNMTKDISANASVPTLHKSVSK